MPPARLRLPTEAQTLFLQCCLLPVRGRGTAFRAWLELVGDPARGVADPLSADRQLAALLYHALRTGEVEAPASFLSALRVATLHEQLRAETVAAAAAEVLG